jgi:anti-sigma factor RsiW
MSCETEMELTAYVDGELTPTEAAAVRTHLAGCGDCRSTEALLRRTLETLRTLPDFEPSRDLRRRVLTGVDRVPPLLGERLRALFRPAVFVPSAVGLVAAGVVAVLLVGPGRRPVLPPELRDPSALDVAMNFDLVSDYEVLGMDSPDDLDVVAHLQELEGRP